MRGEFLDRRSAPSAHGHPMDEEPRSRVVHRTSTTLSDQVGSGLFSAQHAYGTPTSVRYFVGGNGDNLPQPQTNKFKDEEVSKGRGKATTRQSVLTMVNAVLGAGVLGFPYVFKSCGLILASALVLSVVAASALSMRLLLLASRHQGLATYEGLAAQSLGRTGRACVDVCVLALNMGSLVAYLNILADTAGTVAGSVVPPGAEPRREAVLAALTLLLALPITLSSRSAPLLAAISQASVTFLVFFGGATALTAFAPEAPIRELLLWRPAGVLLAFPVVVYGFTAHQVLFSIYQALQSASVRSMTRVIDHSMAVSTGMYLTVGVAGYIAYGPGTAGDLLRNLGGSERGVLCRAFERALRVGYGLSVLGTLPLVILPLRGLALNWILAPWHRAVSGVRMIQMLPRRITHPSWRWLSRKRAETTSSRKHASTIRHSASETLHGMTHDAQIAASTLWLLAVDAGLLGLACLLAIRVPNVEFAFGLAGSTASLLLAFVLPGLIFLRSIPQVPGSISVTTTAVVDDGTQGRSPRVQGPALGDDHSMASNQVAVLRDESAAGFEPVQQQSWQHSSKSSRRRLDFDSTSTAVLKETQDAPQADSIIPTSLPSYYSTHVSSPVRRARSARVAGHWEEQEQRWISSASTTSTSQWALPILPFSTRLSFFSTRRLAFFLVILGLISMVLCTHALMAAMAREARIARLARALAREGQRAAEAAVSGARARTEAAQASGLALATVRLHDCASSVADLESGLRMVLRHLEQRGGAAGSREVYVAKTALQGAKTRLDGAHEALSSVAQGLGTAARLLRRNASSSSSALGSSGDERILQNGYMPAIKNNEGRKTTTAVDDGSTDAKKEALPWRRKSDDSGGGDRVSLLLANNSTIPCVSSKKEKQQKVARPLLQVALSEVDLTRPKTAEALDELEQSVHSASEALLTARITADGARSRLTSSSRAKAPRRAAEGLAATLRTLGSAMTSVQEASRKLDELTASRLVAMDALLRKLGTQRGDSEQKPKQASSDVPDKNAGGEDAGIITTTPSNLTMEIGARLNLTAMSEAAEKVAAEVLASAKHKAATSLQDSQKEDAQRAIEIAKIITRDYKESEQVIKHAEEHHANQTSVLAQQNRETR